MFSTALRKALKTYNFSTFYHDLFAGFVVSLLALPLSMALSIAVGLPPQHGIYTAIVAGAIVPLLGGSNWQVTGPTAAFVVILEPIVAELGLRGIIWSGILAGFILLFFGFSKLGRFINYIPYPVSTGFTAGIAVVLATSSLNDFLGLGIKNLSGDYIHKFLMIVRNISEFSYEALAVGTITLFLLFFANRFIKVIPNAITAIMAGTLISIILSKFGFHIATIGSQFSYLDTAGNLVSGIPPYPPIFHLPNFTMDDIFSIPSRKELKTLLFPAFAIAILAALESLLAASVADNMAGTKHDPNSELSALGIGNILAALTTGIPATGAIARTATNVQNDAKTPLAATMHALFIMAFVLLLANYISYIPMAALAALLIYTSYRMSHIHQFTRTIQIAPRSDVYVLLICFTLTVFVDMVAGVGVGVVCASFLLISNITNLTQVEIGNSTTAQSISKGALIYKISGPIFFGTIEKAFQNYNFSHDLTNKVILDMSEVPFIDMTGLVALKAMLTTIANENRAVHIVSNRTDITDLIKQKIADNDNLLSVKFNDNLAEAF